MTLYGTPDRVREGRLAVAATVVCAGVYALVWLSSWHPLLFAAPSAALLAIFALALGGRPRRAPGPRPAPGAAPRPTTGPGSARPGPMRPGSSRPARPEPGRRGAPAQPYRMRPAERGGGEGADYGMDTTIDTGTAARPASPPPPVPPPLAPPVRPVPSVPPVPPPAVAPRAADPSATRALPESPAPPPPLKSYQRVGDRPHVRIIPAAQADPERYAHRERAREAERDRRRAAPPSPEDTMAIDMRALLNDPGFGRG